MTKTIDTLVEDVYALFDTTPTGEIDEEALEVLAVNIKDAIKRSIREAGEVHAPSIRMSKIGTPNRKLWFEMTSDPSERETFTPPTLIKFLYGHILEELLLFFCKQAGHKVEGEQDECDLLGVKGHRDAKIDNVIIDVKTASGYGFKKFQTGSITKGDDPFGYIAQISGYQRADPEADQSKVGFLTMNKESGEICLLKVDSIDLIDPEQRITEIRDILDKDTPPPTKCYEPIKDGEGGNLVLQKACGSWCPFRDRCWDNLRYFQYSKEVKCFTHVEKTPRVPEITKDGEIL